MSECNALIDRQYINNNLPVHLNPTGSPSQCDGTLGPSGEQRVKFFKSHLAKNQPTGHLSMPYRWGVPPC